MTTPTKEQIEMKDPCVGCEFADMIIPGSLTPSCFAPCNDRIRYLYKLQKQKRKVRNRRTNHLVTYKGETRCIKEWAEITGIKYYTLLYRLRRGWPVEAALNALLEEGK